MTELLLPKRGGTTPTTAVMDGYSTFRRDRRGRRTGGAALKKKDKRGSVRVQRKEPEGYREGGRA